MALENTRFDLRPRTVDGQAQDRLVDDFYERDTGRSNFVAFLLGGVVIAGGLLAFLYFDSDNLADRDGMTTGSLGRLEAPAPSLQPKPSPTAPTNQ